MVVGVDKRKRRILVVDDERIVSDAARLMLQYLGHEVTIASNGREALACFEKEIFDLVFTDYSMPGMRGDQLAACLKQLRPGQPVAMITAYAEILPPIKDVDAVLGKPFLLQHLRDTIEKLAPIAPAQELSNS